MAAYDELTPCLLDGIASELFALSWGLCLTAKADPCCGLVYRQKVRGESTRGAGPPARAWEEGYGKRQHQQATHSNSQAHTKLNRRRRRGRGGRSRGGAPHLENRPFPALAAANAAALSFLEAALSALPNAFSDLLSLLLACEGAGGGAGYAQRWQAALGSLRQGHELQRLGAGHAPTFGDAARLLFVFLYLSFLP